MTSPKEECTRCGRCCLGSSPTLQGVDVSLFHSGRLSFSQLYTLRAGELVWDNIAGELRITAEELVKVKEKGNKEGCLFYDGEENACRIYAHRPVQCATLNCRDPREFLRVHGGPKITRREVVEDRILLGLIEEHENRCSYRVIEGHVERIEREGEKAVGKLLELSSSFSVKPLLEEAAHLTGLDIHIHPSQRGVRSGPRHEADRPGAGAKELGARVDQDVTDRQASTLRERP
jgi:Fe-S-cluster containining protein